MTVDIPHAARVCLDELQAAGLSEPAAVGVLGNFYVESGLSTTIKGDSGLATGLCQWHPDRWRGLLAWAGSTDRDPFALVTQVRYAIGEAKLPVGGSCWDDLERTRDVDTAAAIFMRKFERPRDQSDAAAKRRADAGRRVAAQAAPRQHPAPPPAPEPKPKPKPPKVHTVRRGETLSGIAADHRTNLAVLRRLNPDLFDRAHRGGDLIQPGEKVKLP